MRKNTFDVIKKVVTILLFIIIVSIFVSLLFVTKDNDLIKDIKTFISSDTKVLYISNKDNYSKYPSELFEKYEINYMYIDSTNLSVLEKTKIEKLVNNKNLSNIIVIFDKGKIISNIIDYKTEDELNIFLQKYNIIPKIIGDTNGILDSAKELINTDFSILYLPYKYTEEIEKQDNILSEISNEYNINYKKIDAYLLSYTQQEKLNLLLNISSVENQIIILIKDKKIIGSIREIENKNNYLNKLNDYKFINRVEDYIEYINYERFEEILNSNNKNIILIGKNECKYCDDVISTLIPIVVNSNISINYLNIETFDSDISKKVESKLIDLGYSDGFTTPLTIITESNKLLDYIIGLSSEKYFIDIFTENGIIK